MLNLNDMTARIYAVSLGTHVCLKHKFYMHLGHVTALEAVSQYRAKVREFGNFGWPRRALVHTDFLTFVFFRLSIDLAGMRH